MTNNTNSEAMIQDIQEVVANAEVLMAATEGQSGKEIESIRARLKANLAVARTKLAQMEVVVKEKAKATDQYVHENPWQSIGVAAGVGLIVGFLLGRK